MLRQTIRILRRSSGVTVLAVLALALGIGANTAVFSVVNAVFLRPLPFPDADRLVVLNETNSQYPISISYPNFMDWRPQTHAFEAMAATASYDATLESRSPAERLPVTYVSAAFFSILRVKPALGRDFGAEDEKAGAPPVVILSNRIWRSHFGADPRILGTAIKLDRRPYTVIGVMPAELRYYRPANLFVPISDAVTRQVLMLRENHNGLEAIARLKPGVALEQARGQMRTIAGRLERAYPESNTGIGARVITLRERVSAGAQQSVMLLLAAVSLVLLIACVNVASLLLARAADRRKEMAIRAALGASRWHVLRQLLLESVALAVAGGAAGVLLSSWSFAAMARLVPAAVDAGGIGIDWRVLLYTLLVSVLTGVVFGLAPAADALRLNLTGALRDGGRTTSGTGTARVRDALVVFEVALALVLLVGAGLLLRTLQQLLSVPLGFQSEQLLTARVSLPDSPDYSYERSAAFFEAIVTKVEAAPGVAHAGVISHVPLRGFFSSMVWFRDDRPVPERGKLPGADQRAASPEYFAAMGIPLLRGRLFTPADGRVTNFKQEELMQWVRGSHFSAVISETMAKRFWPGEDPVGKTFRPGFPEMGLAPVKILGVVGDVRDYGPDSDPVPTFYWSSCHFPTRAATLMVRTRGGDPAGMAAAVRGAAAGLEPAAMVSDVATMESIVRDAVAGRRLNMQLIAIFAAMALTLAAVGVYGVMAYTVNRRSHEIGVRMALGAGRAQIVRMVVGKALLLGALGIATGSAAALGLTRLLSSMLFGVRPADPLTFGCVAGILLAVTAAASGAPARRATRTSPMNALRSE